MIVVYKNSTDRTISNTVLTLDAFSWHGNQILDGFDLFITWICNVEFLDLPADFPFSLSCIFQVSN